jgi:RNA polymerase sigma factor (sigma-70 family)
MTPDDALKQLDQGDPTVLNGLLEDCRPGLLRFINSQLPFHLQTQVAEEILQNACANVWKKLRDRQSAPELHWDDRKAFCAWLREFAANSLADWHRYITAKKRHYQRLLDNQKLNEADDSGPSLLEAAARDEDTPSKVLGRQEREDAFQRAWRTALTNRERTALELRYVEGLRVPVVAALMDLAPGSLKNLCLDAKAKLRAVLGSSWRYFSSR